MRTSVYSAARAFFPLRGRSAEQAWEELTGMFKPDNPNGKSYIVNGYPLTCLRRARAEIISVGDWFKYGILSETYVHVVESTPHLHFAYDEVILPMSGKDIDMAHEQDNRTRMEFFLRGHPEATLVEIRRRSKCNMSFIERMLGVHASQDARLVEHVLLGRISNRDDIVEGHITIKRDDSYRIDF